MASVVGLRAVFLGAPGAGKGTQAQRLAAAGRALHISTGDMLREHVKSGTTLGRAAKSFMDAGKLVPDDVIIAMVEARIGGIGGTDSKTAPASWILDGFPRTLLQASALDKKLSAPGLTHAVWFAVPAGVLTKRLTGRRTCGKCGAIWHVEFKPTKKTDLCDVCGGTLVQRDDDRPAAVQQRLDVFAQQTEPLLAYYRESGKLVEIDANRSPDQVFQQLTTAVERRPAADSNR